MKLSKLFNFLFGNKDVYRFEVGSFQCRVIVRGQAPTTLSQLERDIMEESMNSIFSKLIAKRMELPK